MDARLHELGLDPGGEAHHNQRQRIRHLLHSCSISIEGGDLHILDCAHQELVNFLGLIYGKITSDHATDESKSCIRDVLEEIRLFMSCSSLDQQIIDVMSFEIPKAVAKLAVVDDYCMSIVDGVIHHFLERCSPRDMLSIFCEALVTTDNILKPSSYFTPILRGLSKVITSINKHHLEQIKVAVPVVLRSLKAGYCDPDADVASYILLFEISIDIADSIQVVCVRGSLHEKLHVLLGLYVLQIKALISYAIGDDVPRCRPLLMRLSTFIPYCGLSYIDLATGRDLEKFIDIFHKGNEDEYASGFIDVKHGAALSVIWGYIYHDVAQATSQNRDFVIDNLKSDCTKRWQALDTISAILPSLNLSWNLKKHAIDFLMDIINGVFHSTACSACQSYTLSICSSLKAIEMVIICAPSNILRNNSLSLFKMILLDVPACQKYAVFKTFIKNSKSPSMVAIFLDFVKERLGIELSTRTSARKFNHHHLKIEPEQPEGFWNCGVLELVEFVLRPPQGGPPQLPEQSDAVLSALNLYRFILIAEKTGGDGRREEMVVWSKKGLQRVYEEWLLPLRGFVTAIMADHQKNKGDGDDHDNVSLDAVCSLNPVVFVLYRCIELVEDGMMHLL